MHVLFETAAGFALFKVTNRNIVKSDSDLESAFETPESASKNVSLVKFQRFESAQEATTVLSNLCEGKVDKPLKKLLKEFSKNTKEELAVYDKVLANSIHEKLQINCIYDSRVLELMRGIRSHLYSLISSESSEQELRNMSVGLSHQISRHKLKFTADKVDTMIVQAISLLDDLDKELNIYAMRVKEWYGWHFPELSKILNDNILYAKTALKIGNRASSQGIDLSEILPEDLSGQVSNAMLHSMGTEISEEDVLNIRALCEELIALNDYRAKLFEYLKNRMNAIAPNLSLLVGELVGARLISHAGSLINLAKQPSSTVQILGAEKALFRALKSRVNTPKYGILYHASLVGQASSKNKGKIARSLAAKCALATRVDALSEKEQLPVAADMKQKIETRLSVLESMAAGSTIRNASFSSNSVDRKKPAVPPTFVAAKADRNPEHLAKTKTEKTDYDESLDVTKKAKKRLKEEPEKELSQSQNTDDVPMPKKKKKVDKKRQE